jgi:predicted nuclease of restriction endonuclease-like (RecB) superfamily
VNAELLFIYWEIGQTILSQQRTEGWGAKVIDRLALDLKTEFPDMRGFSVRNMKYMRAFAEAYPGFAMGQPAVAQKQQADRQKSEIVQPLVAQIPWAHHLVILNKIKDEGQRRFYLQKTAENGWSKSVLASQIESGLHLRQGAAITNFKTTLPKPQSDLARETLKNPYLFDFVGIGEEMQERELERALVANIKKFLLELGKGFAYVGNQFNLAVEEDDYFLDLLFYNYHLHCFVVFELKVGDFKPEYTGKLNFYINTVNEQVKGPDDKPTIGVLLCKTPNKTVVKYSLQNIGAPIGVSEYQFTKALPEELQSELPTIEDLEQELEKTVDVKQTPLQEKLARLKDRMAQSGREEVQKERDADDIRYLFNELVPQLEHEINEALRPIATAFAKVELGRRINSISGPFLIEADLEKQLLKENVNLLGLSLRMEGFKKGGTDAFGLWKDLFIELHHFKYGVGAEQHKPWVEKLYHQKWTKEEVRELAERWCEEVVEAITERLEKLQ